jgi:RNA polymerase sigma factor (TIGR02999 family)
MNEESKVLSTIEQGDPTAAEQLLPLVYDSLRQLAAWRLTREKGGQTLQPTALVHEAYLRLVGEEGTQWNGRAHFFAAAALAMRRVLVESARQKQATKRGGGVTQRVPLEDFHLIEDSPQDLLDLDDALIRLAAVEPAKAELVQLRFFAGLSIPDAAAALGISAATAERWWSYARAWLYSELERGEGFLTDP